MTPFRSTGTNLYYLQQLLSYAQQDQDPTAMQAVGEVLDDLVCLSLPVARIWGFNDSKDTSSIRHSPQEGFREEGLRGLDQAIWEAKRRGIRVIIPLVNNWGEYGGLPAYAAWAVEQRVRRHVRARRLLHERADEAVVEGLRAARWPTRVNTFTGVAYRDEPAILAWEIGNELRCSSCAGTTKLPDAVAELADVPEADGAQPADRRRRRRLRRRPDAVRRGCPTTTRCAATRGPASPSSGAIEALDMLSYHFYPLNYGFTTARDTEIWIERHQAIAALTGKVAYLGECGFAAPDQERGQTYDGWLRHLFVEADGQLGLFWQLSPAARTNNDGFAVYSRRDSATAWILARWAN